MEEKVIPSNIVTGLHALRPLELRWLELLGVENEQTIYTRKYNGYGTLFCRAYKSNGGI